MKKITKLNQLPPEFNLIHYDEINLLTPEDWTTNLHEIWLTLGLIKQGDYDHQSGFGIIRDNTPNNTSKLDNSKKYTSNH